MGELEYSYIIIGKEMGRAVSIIGITAPSQTPLLAIGQEKHSVCKNTKEATLHSKIWADDNFSHWLGCM